MGLTWEQKSLQLQIQQVEELRNQNGPNIGVQALINANRAVRENGGQNVVNQHLLVNQDIPRRRQAQNDVVDHANFLARAQNDPYLNRGPVVFQPARRGPLLGPRVLLRRINVTQEQLNARITQVTEQNDQIVAGPQAADAVQGTSRGVTTRSATRRQEEEEIAAKRPTRE